MKIKFIGVGSAFTTPEYYQSNMLITAANGKQLLLDCGTDVRFSLSEGNIQYEDPAACVDAVYISHLHSDHIGGMEWMAFRTYFDPNRKRPKLFMENNLMHDLWNYSLKGGLGCIEGKGMHLTDYFDCRPAHENGDFCWEGIRFLLVRMPHVITGYKNFYSYGLLIQDADKKGPAAFITTDTQFTPHTIDMISKKAEVIFHDCETSPFKSIVHAHYDDLCTLPSELKKKMWLYHYQPHPTCQANSDGFAGFVKKGQEFVF